jgi:hypothetical protein
MALTPEEEMELAELEEEQSSILSGIADLKKEFQPKEPEIQEEELPETSMIEAGLRGAAQGLTFDYADEIGAKTESFLTGKPYEQALKESRAEYKLAQEDYPVTSFLGNVAGGVGQAAAVAAATGGVGAVAPAASRLKKVADAARALYLPTKEASALKNVAQVAKTGALMSGVTATGASEEEGLGRLKEVPQALASGAVVGGVLGGAAEGIKKGAGVIKKMGEEGKLPYSFRKAIDLYEAGKQGKGYITEESLEKIDQNLMKSAEEGINLIQTSLDDVRNVKSEILKKVPTRVPIQNSLIGLQKNLENQVANNLIDAEPALKGVSRILNGLDLDEAGQSSAFSVNNIINQLDDYIFSQKDLSAEVKKAFRNSADELKLLLRSSVNPQEAIAALRESPEYLDIYKRYISALPEQELINSEVLAKAEQEELKKWVKQAKTSLTKESKKRTPEQQKSINKEFNRAVGGLKRAKDKQPKSMESFLEELPQEDVDTILQEAMGVLEDKAAVNPLGQLDAVMHNVLNASENLGKVTRGKGTDVSRKFKLFDVMRGSSSDTGTGQKALEKYNIAVNDLQKANPELANQFEKITKPSILEMENKKFLQGAKLGEESKEGILQSAITAPAKIAGVVSNVAAQTSRKLGSPAVAGMLRAKNVIDSQLQKTPENTLLNFFSATLKSAIDEKDSVRQAAMLNTLNQYESFRKLFSGEEE